MSSVSKIVAYICIAAIAIVGIIVTKDAFLPLLLGVIAVGIVSHSDSE